MRICFIRSDKGYLDSRVGKEMYALSAEHEVFLLGWNRDLSAKEVIHEKHRIHDKEFDFYLIPEPAAYGAGMKHMVAPMKRFWKRAYKFLRANVDKFDAIHVVNFDTARPAFKIAKKFGKKIVYDIFDYYSDSYVAPDSVKKVIRSTENKFISRADMTIICSEERKAQIAESHPKKLIIVENSPEDCEIKDDFIIDSASVPGRPKIAYTGMLVFDRFLRETCEVMMNRTDVEWHVAGYGVLRPFIEESAAKYENIFYYGPLPYEDILALEKKCDIMTALQNPSVPNNKYSAPNKFYEALLLGKPLIMVKNGSLYNEILNNDLGEVIDVSNGNVKEEINDALDRILAKQNEWKDMGSRARSLYDTKYPWSNSAKTLLDGYRSLGK